jgi:hypothetical protein
LQDSGPTAYDKIIEELSIYSMEAKGGILKNGNWKY